MSSFIFFRGSFTPSVTWRGGGHGPRGSFRGSRNCHTWMILIEVAGIGLNLSPSENSVLELSFQNLPDKQASLHLCKLLTNLAIQLLKNGHKVWREIDAGQNKTWDLGWEAIMWPELIDNIDRKNSVWHLGRRVHKAWRAAVTRRTMVLICSTDILQLSGFCQRDPIDDSQ